ncbi:MAG: hypothetical protein A2284_09300 [Deltaproteobacteria bacterium RIFOXYA12_FULL_61_11]|nr:MAG: hypothetical protein A2284_09300 [Deltaproteobacteria bacterium RIFOXYA12_FULL_61_11]
MARRLFCASLFLCISVVQAARTPSIQNGYEQAQAAYQRGEITTAISQLKQVLKNDKTQLAPYLLLLKIYSERNDFSNTLSVLTVLERQFPDEQLVHQFKGDYYTVRQELDTAVASYRRCIQLGAENYFCYAGLASIYLQRLQAEEGIKLLEGSIERFRPDEKSRLYNYLSSYYVMRHDYDRSLTYLNKALRIDPGYLLTYLNAAQTLNRMGHFKEALIFLETAEHNTPLDPKVLLNKGIAYLGLKQPLEAIHVFDKILNKEPDQPQALYNKALCLLETGRTPEAVELLRRGKRHALPMSEVSRQIEKLLAKYER